MRTKWLGIALVGLLLASCSEEATKQDETQVKLVQEVLAWKDADVSKSFTAQQHLVSHYSFDAENIRKVFKETQPTHFWFGLDYSDQQQIELSTIGINGSEIKSIQLHADKVMKNDFKESLKTLNNSYQYETSLTKIPVVAEHLLSYKDSYDYIQTWENALLRNDVKGVITNEGKRIIRYSIEAQVIEHIINYKNVSSVGIFFGVNTEGQLTTVFIGKDHKGNFALLNSAKDGDDDGSPAFDFSQPCPNTCDNDPFGGN